MIRDICKFLLAAICLGAFFYAIQAFGYSVALLLLPAAAVFLVVSVFNTRLEIWAKLLARSLFLLSSSGFLLLMLSATIGGSFHLSPSNQVIAVLLVAAASVSSTAFFWRSSQG